MQINKPDRSSSEFASRLCAGTYGRSNTDRALLRFSARARGARARPGARVCFSAAAALQRWPGVVLWARVYSNRQRCVSTSAYRRRPAHEVRCPLVPARVALCMCMMPACTCFTRHVKWDTECGTRRPMRSHARRRSNACRRRRSVTCCSSGLDDIPSNIITCHVFCWACCCTRRRPG